MPSSEDGLYFRIGGDADELRGAFDELGKMIDQAGGRFMEMGKVLTGALTIPLAAIGTAAFAAGTAMDEALDTIRIKTGQTGDSLSGLEASFRNVFANVPNSAREVSDAIAAIAVRTGETGPALETLATQMLTLARIAGTEVAPLIAQATRLFGDWGIEVEKQGPTMDLLFKISQNTGIAIGALTEKLVYFGAPLRQFGFSLEEAAAILGKFEQEGVNSNQVLTSLRLALGNFAKAGRDPVQAFEEVVESIKKADVAQGNLTAVQVFGRRAAVDMAAAIREGRFEYQDLIEKVNASGDSIMKAAKDTEGFAESWAIFKNKMTLALEPLGTALLSALDGVVKAMQPVIDLVQRAAQAFADLDPVTQLVIFGLGALAAAIGPVTIAFGAFLSSISTIASFTSGIGGAFSALTGVLPSLSSGISLVSTAFSAIGGSVTIALGPLALITAAVIAVGAAAYLMWKNWDDIWPVLRGLWQDIASMAESIWGGIKAFFVNLWEGTAAIFATAWESITGALKSAWDTVAGWAESIWGGIASYLRTIWDGIASAFSTAWSGIKNALSLVWGAIKSAASEAWEWIVAKVQWAVDKLALLFPETAKALKDWGTHAGTAKTETEKLAGAAQGAVPHIKGIGDGAGASGKAIKDMGEASTNASKEISAAFAKLGIKNVEKDAQDALHALNVLKDSGVLSANQLAEAQAKVGLALRALAKDAQDHKNIFSEMYDKPNKDLDLLVNSLRTFNLEGLKVSLVMKEFETMDQALLRIENKVRGGMGLELMRTQVVGITTAAQDLEASAGRLGVTLTKDVSKALEIVETDYNRVAAAFEKGDASAVALQQAWVKLLQAQLDAARKMGDGSRESLANIAALTAGVQGAQVELDRMTGKASGMGVMWTNFSKQVSTIWTDFGRDVSKAIVHWEGFGAAVTKIATSIKEAFIRHIIEGGINQIMKSLGLLDLDFAKMGKALDVMASRIASLFGFGGAGAGAGAAGGTPGVPTGGGATGATGGDPGSGGISGAVNMVTGVVTAVTSLLSYLSGRRMEQDIGRIEVTSRGVLNQLVSLQDSANQFWPRLGEIRDFAWRLVEIGDEQLVLASGGGGGNMQAALSELGGVLHAGFLALANTITEGLTAIYRLINEVTNKYLADIAYGVMMTYNALNKPGWSGPTQQSGGQGAALPVQPAGAPMTVNLNNNNFSAFTPQQLANAVVQQIQFGLQRS